jgi:hypothetical protein
MIEYTVRVYSDGTKKWHLNGKLHREDGPAVEYPDGSRYWYLEDKPHRTDGPAIELPSGSKMWYLNGKLHRTDGPAIESSEGYKKWVLDGKELTEEEFHQKMNPKPCLGKKIIVDGVEYILT